jgi:hypothetical protein
MLLMVSQSVVLGYLIDYFSIQYPSAEDTRNAYLYALGSYPITNLMVASYTLGSYSYSYSNPIYYKFNGSQVVVNSLCMHAGLCVLTVLLMIVVCHAFLIGFKIGMISSITLTAAIYQKVNNKVIATPKMDCILYFQIVDTIAQPRDCW